MFETPEYKPGQDSPGGDWTEVRPGGDVVKPDVHVPPGHRFPPTPKPGEGFVPEKR